MMHWCTDASWYRDVQYSSWMAIYGSIHVSMNGDTWCCIFLIFQKLQILVLRIKNNSTKITEIVNRWEANQCAFLSSLYLPAGFLWMTLWCSFCIILFKKESILSDIVMFCLNPLILKLVFLFWLTCNYHDMYWIALWIS